MWRDIDFVILCKEHRWPCERIRDSIRGDYRKSRTMVLMKYYCSAHTKFGQDRLKNDEYSNGEQCQIEPCSACMLAYSIEVRHNVALVSWNMSPMNRPSWLPGVCKPQRSTIAYISVVLLCCRDARIFSSTSEQNHLPASSTQASMLWACPKPE